MSPVVLEWFGGLWSFELFYQSAFIIQNVMELNNPCVSVLNLIISTCVLYIPIRPNDEALNYTDLLFFLHQYKYNNAFVYS